MDRYPTRSKDEAATFIENARSMEAANESILWALCFPTDQRLIGTIGYWRMIPAHYRAEIGYVLHPQHQGKGLMTEAMKAVIHYAFEVMQLHSIEANINPLNIASKQVLLKNGFVQEAYFRENFYFNGVFLDSMIFSRINNK
jgi:ribosomal-protein-alanine N-acetyltransferase